MSYLGMLGKSGPAFGRTETRGGRRVAWADTLDETGVSSAIMELGGLPEDMPALPVFSARRRRRDEAEREATFRAEYPAVGRDAPPNDGAAAATASAGADSRAAQGRPGRARVPGVTQGWFPQLARGCRLRGLALPQGRYVWDPQHRWLFDAVWRSHRVALMLDGGGVRGHDAPGAGWIRDAQQLNAAAIEGWLVLRVTPAQIYDGSVYELVARALAAPWRGL